MRRAALILLSFSCVLSCSPRIASVVRTDIQYRDRVSSDTVYVRDSVHVTERVRGDTVRITEFRDRWRYRDRTVRDTVREERRDTCVLRVETPRPLSAGQTFKVRAFWWLLGTSLGLLLWTLRKPLLKMITL